jgi:menaquinone-9 beta-reductase
MKKVEFTILGGGIAGLCAAKKLLEKGIAPLVIEAGDYPSHKICGEFLSPASLTILQQWGIQPVPIRQLQIHTLKQTLPFTFPAPAGSLSHLTLDRQLAQQIRREGATLLTQTSVEQLIPATTTHSWHTLVLSSGESFTTKHLFIATGKLPHQGAKKPRMRFVGCKTHFAEMDLSETLHLFSFPGVYLGLSPIEQGKANLACLATMKKFQLSANPQAFMQEIIQSHPFLSSLLDKKKNLLDGWMNAQVPAFGFRSPPHWIRAYWIGDAATSVPPACGHGLSLAITGGCCAVEFAIKDEYEQFRNFWHRQHRSQMFFSKQLHALFLHPTYGNIAMALGRWFPSLIDQLFALTRQTQNSG